MPRIRLFHPHVWAASIALLAVGSPAALALDPNRAISQYARDQWDVTNGYPGGYVYAMAQTDDGYLWIGTERGLIRFDGMSFQPVQASEATPVYGLATDLEGNLWERTPLLNVLRSRAGVLEKVSSIPDQSLFRFSAMCRGTASMLLSSGARGVLEYSKSRFRTLGASTQMPETVISLAQAEDERLWIGTRDTGLFSFHDGLVKHIETGLPDNKINCLLPRGGPELWVGTDNGVVNWNGTALTSAGIPPVLMHGASLAMIRDHDSNTWVGTAGALYRVNKNGVSSILESGRNSVGAVSALLEDREGNLWVGGALGIQRFRQSLFLTYAAPLLPPSQNYGAISVDDQGRTWFGPSEGGLFWLKGAQIGELRSSGLERDQVYSIASRGKDLWIGRQGGGLTQIREQNGSMIGAQLKWSGLLGHPVYAVHVNRDGTLWVGTLGGGAAYAKDGRFHAYTTTDGLVSNTVQAIAEGRDGTMWFGTPDGLSSLCKGHWNSFTARDGLPPGRVTALLGGSAGVLWIGTAEGLAYQKSGKIEVARNQPDSLFEPIAGMAEDRAGRLWVTTAHRLLRVNPQGLLNGGSGAEAVREYGILDGLEATQGVDRFRSVTTDGLGRIWFSTSRGISVIAPEELEKASAPIISGIQAISSDGKPVVGENPVRISSAHQRLTFSYSGVSLSAPERVQFRYMLEGFDHGWSQAVHGREANYTNLSPGAYRFRVMASNREGVWNGGEANVPVEIDPQFWQTWWFRILCGMVFLGSSLAFYRLRMHQLKVQMNLRFEERVGERMRISQELHDTLLQNITGLSLQIGALSKVVTAPESAKERLRELRRQAEDCLREARQSVWDLRSTESDALDLVAALRESGEQLTAGKPTNFIFSVEGETRPLAPNVRQQLLRIGREAIGNAVHHAQAKRIEVSLAFEPARFRLRIADDGIGFDLEEARKLPGHFGLATMRERAEQIHGSLEMKSALGQGTSIEILVAEIGKA